MLNLVLLIANCELRIANCFAVPFKGQESRWQSCDQQRYREILACAVDIVIVSPGSYTSAKMQVRNKYMVDHCDRLLALHDGSAGGTANCVNYAKSKDVEIINVWKSWVKYRGF